MWRVKVCAECVCAECVCVCVQSVCVGVIIHGLLLLPLLKEQVQTCVAAVNGVRRWSQYHQICICALVHAHIRTHTHTHRPHEFGVLCGPSGLWMIPEVDISSHDRHRRITQLTVCLDSPTLTSLKATVSTLDLEFFNNEGEIMFSVWYTPGVVLHMCTWIKKWRGNTDFCLENDWNSN